MRNAKHRIARKLAMAADTFNILALSFITFPPLQS
jgi:hypothetical protein